MRISTPTKVQVAGPELTTRRLVMFALLAALLATFLTDYRYAESGLEEIDPLIRRVMDSGHLANDFFTDSSDEFGPRFYSTHLIAALASPESLPVIYFSLTLVINATIALLTGLFARELFRTNGAGLFAVALAMGAASFRLGAAGQAHASEPNSYWMSFPFAICAVWAATRIRPVLAGLMAGLAALLHPTFGAEVGGLVFTSLVVALWARRNREGTPIPLAGVAAGVVVFTAFLALVAVPYATGTRIPDEEFLEIMALRMPHHLLPSTFDASEWLQGLMFLATVCVAWRWLQLKGLPGRFEANIFIALAASLLLILVGGYLFVEVWPWKPWFIGIPYRLTGTLLWLGMLVIGGSASRRIVDTTGVGEGMVLQSSCVNPIASGLVHLAVAVNDRRRFSRPLAVVGIVVALSLGIGFTEWRDLAQFVIINGLAAWFLLAPNRVWTTIVGVGAPIALAGSLLAYQTLVDTEDALDRVGPEILPAHVEGPEASIARAAKDLTPVDSVILTPPPFGSFRVLSERAIVVDMRDIPYQEDAMADWMDRIVSIYGMPSPAGFEIEDLGEQGDDQLEESYKAIDDRAIRALCDLYPITYAVLYDETATAYPVIEKNGTYQLVRLDDCG